jgi:hypothetical protein
MCILFNVALSHPLNKPLSYFARYHFAASFVVGISSLWTYYIVIYGQTGTIATLWDLQGMWNRSSTLFPSAYSLLQGRSRRLCVPPVWTRMATCTPPFYTFIHFFRLSFSDIKFSWYNTDIISLRKRPLNLDFLIPMLSRSHEFLNHTAYRRVSEHCGMCICSRPGIFCSLSRLPVSLHWTCPLEVDYLLLVYFRLNSTVFWLVCLRFCTYVSPLDLIWPSLDTESPQTPCWYSRYGGSGLPKSEDYVIRIDNRDRARMLTDSII